MLTTQVFVLAMSFRVSMCEKYACRANFGACVHNFSIRDNILNKLLCLDHHLDVPEVWTKGFCKGTNIGSNNLHTYLDFGDGVLLPKVAKKVGWTKMEM
jgi:hypothetical protein